MRRSSAPDLSDVSKIQDELIKKSKECHRKIADIKTQIEQYTKLLEPISAKIVELHKPNDSWLKTLDDAKAHLEEVKAKSPEEYKNELVKYDQTRNAYRDAFPKTDLNELLGLRDTQKSYLTKIKDLQADLAKYNAKVDSGEVLEHKKLEEYQKWHSEEAFKHMQQNKARKTSTAESKERSTLQVPRSGHGRSKSA